MPSQLYERARRSLHNRDADSLSRSENWLLAQTLGRRLLANLQRESHLVGSNQFGDPSVMTGFLNAWAAAHAGADCDESRQNCFCGICSVHHRSGTPLDPSWLPKILYRYVSSRTLLAELVESVLGIDAKAAMNDGSLTVEDALSRLANSWDRARLRDKDTLGHGDTVFATFEHSAGAPRDSAKEMAEALAHPVLTSSGTEKRFLFEITYHTASVKDHRMPTIADAGWFPYFEPAPEVRPDPDSVDTCAGWTKPFEGRVPQPEIVHENCSVKCLLFSPRLLGWI